MTNIRELDWHVISAALALSVIGIFLIMSAQFYAESEVQKAFFQKQIVWLAISLIVFSIVINLPLRLFDLTAYLLLGTALILLVLVLFVGSSRMGANRWISLGPINFAPSDIAKLAVLLALSRFFAYTKFTSHSKRRLAISACMTIIPVMLILKQPDLGTSLVFWVILFALWFWSGLSPLYMVLIVSPLISTLAASHWLAWSVYLAVLLIFLFLFRPGLLFSVVTVVTNLAFGMLTPYVWNGLADYQKLRILTFLDPGRDPRGAGYQIIQSKIAIGSGGLWGKGYLGGSQSRLDFLPEPHTDFVFSVLGEELGLWGCLMVMFLFGVIFYRCIRIASRCRSKFASNIVIGAGAILLFQFFVNIGMTLGFMPVTGLPLPFLSYGGTSLVMTWTLIGLIVLADYNWQEY